MQYVVPLISILNGLPDQYFVLISLAISVLSDILLKILTSNLSIHSGEVNASHCQVFVSPSPDFVGEFCFTDDRWAVERTHFLRELEWDKIRRGLEKRGVNVLKPLRGF